MRQEVGLAELGQELRHASLTVLCPALVESIVPNLNVPAIYKSVAGMETQYSEPSAGN
jgi:hypothetical protein